MAILRIKSGKRGRPLQIDPEQELRDLMFDTLPKVQKRLSQFREETSGVRDRRFLGSETELPEFIDTTLTALNELRKGEQLDYDTVRQIRSAITTTKRLASVQQRSFGTALDAAFTESYFTTLAYYERNSSTYTKKINTRTKNLLNKLTASQRQKLFLSVGYQDPATMGEEYEHIREWAISESGKKEMTMNEAWSYLRYRRWKDAIKDLF